MKWKVSEIVKECEVNLNGFPMKLNLNILPLGSYDILISMDWLEKHHVMLDCLHKSILCTDRQGNQVKVHGILKKVFVRKIFSLQKLSLECPEPSLGSLVCQYTRWTFVRNQA